MSGPLIGHGGYHLTLEEGLVAFANEQGQTHLLRATELGRLLSNHPSLRLVVLNACEGAKGESEISFPVRRPRWPARGFQPCWRCSMRSLTGRL